MKPSKMLYAKIVPTIFAALLLSFAGAVSAAQSKLCSAIQAHFWRDLAFHSQIALGCVLISNLAANTLFAWLKRPTR